MQLPTYDEIAEHARKKGITTIDGNDFFDMEIIVKENEDWKLEMLKQDGMNQVRDFIKDREDDIFYGIEDFDQLATMFEYLFSRPARPV